MPEIASLEKVKESLHPQTKLGRQIVENIGEDMSASFRPVWELVKDQGAEGNAGGAFLALLSVMTGIMTANCKVSGDSLEKIRADVFEVMTRLSDREMARFDEVMRKTSN